LIESERNEKRGKLLADMTPGDIRKGTVRTSRDFGAFIDLNGIDGLAPHHGHELGRIVIRRKFSRVGRKLTWSSST